MKKIILYSLVLLFAIFGIVGFSNQSGAFTNDKNQSYFAGTVEVEGDIVCADGFTCSLGTTENPFDAINVDALQVNILFNSDAENTLATTTIQATGTATILTVRQVGSGDIVNFFDAGVEVMTILDGGNVGIGTSSPDSLLTLMPPTQSSKSLLKIAKRYSLCGNGAS